MSDPLAIQQRALHDCVAMLGESSESARTIRLEGVTAAIVPASPERSVPNSVAYDNGESLVAALEELASEYENAGVAAWTVWVPEMDERVAGELEAAGHRFDGQPRAMSLKLEDLEPVELGDLDYSRDADPSDLGPLNELAYGPGAAGMAKALASPPEWATIWAARDEGEIACVLATIDHEDDLGFYFVATHPDHRRRGLTTRLMTAALLDARDRDLRTSSLQASAMGMPIYLRLGYSDDFAIHLYERRSPS